MPSSKLTEEEQRILLNMETSAQYGELYRKRRNVARVIVSYESLLRLKKVCTALGVRHTSAASILIHSHNHSITEESVSWLRELDLMPIILLAPLSISQLASRTAHRMSRVLGCKKGSIATAILLDCLPLLETMPETIPGIKSLVRYPSKQRRAIGIYQETRAKISARCRLLANESNERLSAADYVRSAISTIPSADIEAIFTGEGFALLLAETDGNSKAACISVDVEVYEYLKSLSGYLGCSVTKMVSFFMEEELRATEKEIEYKRPILPLEPIERWKAILSQYIRLDIEK